ncbi:MAG: zinc-binding dehydrogenase [Chloroflexi bacterium]|nr:zinc-binding dehydrogenase [Chloroflexota bacterium]
MKAWRLHGLGDHRLDEVPMPKAAGHDVLIRIKVIQPSVTDTSVMSGDVFTEATKWIPKWLAEGKPIQRGHEYCGEIVETGQNVTSVKVGDRVCSAGGKTYCGSCAMCLSGRHSECLSPLIMGREVPGAFAEYMCLPEWGVVRIPQGPTDNEVAALQPLSPCIASVRSAEIKIGDTVVVLGQGAVGLGILQAARLAGAGLLVAVARRPENLELAKKFGATDTINTTQTDVVEEVKRLTNGDGADVVFDAAGGSPKYGLSGFETVRQALRMVRRGGKIIQSALLPGAVELDTVLMQRYGIRYQFPLLSDNECLKIAAIWVASGRIQIGPQITHVLHGLERLNEAIKITENKAKHHAVNPAQVVVLRLDGRVGPASPVPGGNHAGCGQHDEYEVPLAEGRDAVRQAPQLLTLRGRRGAALDAVAELAHADPGGGQQPETYENRAHRCNQADEHGHSPARAKQGAERVWPHDKH